jgi:D-alanyl-D-alanine endopeptidase (penicillin-binding protein 7)
LGLLSITLAAPAPLLAATAVKKKPAVAQKKAKVASQKAGLKRASAKPVKSTIVSRTNPGSGKRAAVLAAKGAAVAGTGLAAASAASAYDHRHDLQASDAPPKLSANAVFVMDQNSREVLVSKNDKAVLPIASLTKLMTGLLVADARLSLDEEITITEDDLDIYKGTGSRLAVGTRLTRGEALHLALMSSENRAAHALGRTYPGGIVNFVRLMNAKAAELGMRDTHYVEPTGLSVENRSSARDLAMLAAAAYQRPLLRELSTSQGYTLESGRRVLQYRNSNRLTSDPNWNIGLQKTGYISEAGRCLVMSARLAGRQVIMVFLDSADKASRIGDAQRVRRYVESVAYADPIERIALGRS